MMKGNIREIGNFLVEPWYLADKFDAMEKITGPQWENIPAGEKVSDGYGGRKTAPEEPGTYTLHELVYSSNTHAGWAWEKVR